MNVMGLKEEPILFTIGIGQSVACHNVEQIKKGELSV